MTEIVATRGPVDEEHLGWITALYGAVDTKYTSIDYVRRQFIDNPFGWSVHAFVMDGNRAAGHCAAVPFRANLGGKEFIVGKIEAVVLAEDHRGRRTDDGRSLAVAMLTAMYEAAHKNAILLLFGLAPPAVAAVHARAGCERRRLEEPTYVAFATPAADEGGGRRGVAVRLLSAAQRALIMVVPRLSVNVTPADTADIGLTAANLPPPATWTISGDVAWDWYRASGLLHTIETPGRFGARALVRLLDAPGADVQVVSWQPRGRPLPAALLLLAAVVRVARARGARTVRFQPWLGTAGNGALTRACRLLGFVRRAETELVLHTDIPELAQAEVRLTPFFYATF